MRAHQNDREEHGGHENIRVYVFLDKPQVQIMFKVSNEERVVGVGQGPCTHHSRVIMLKRRYVGLIIESGLLTIT